jgi:hypothetical protein
VDLKSLSLDGLKALQANINGELAARAGRGLLVWNAEGYRVQAPNGGAVLHVSYALSSASYDEWYPTEAAAMAALYKLAGDKPVTGRFVNLTKQGCSESSAWVEVQPC